MVRLLPMLLLIIVVTDSADAQDREFHGAVEAYHRGDYAIALAVFMPLAERGYAKAQYNLAVMYGKGLGVVEDDSEAVCWFRLAADQGDVWAQNNLGAMYMNGQGVPQNFVLANMWYTLAAVQGHGNARSMRDVAARQLTSEQFAEAQRLVREWRPK